MAHFRRAQDSLRGPDVFLDRWEKCFLLSSRPRASTVVAPYISLSSPVPIFISICAAAKYNMS